MSTLDSIFVAVPETSSQVAAWLVDTAGCEVTVTEADAVGLRVRGTTGDRWLWVVVQSNGYVVPDPEPEDVQAMDPDAIEIQFRGGGSEAVLHREAALLFDTLVATRPDVPLLLVHNLDTLVTAHLPGVGTHSFDPLITPNEPDLATWRPGWSAEARRLHRKVAS